MREEGSVVHEVGIASAIVESVLHEMQARNLPSVCSIAVKVGRLTDVDPEALSFGFDILTRDTRLAATKLDIHRIPICGVCESCATDFEVEDYRFVCPHCDSRKVKLTSGMELDIAYLEVPE